MDWLFDPNSWIALVTLTVLEIVLGIDNIVFISILSSKLPVDQQTRARRTGLSLAMITRLLLLFSMSWLVHLTAPLFTVFGEEISGRDLILLSGGAFLLAKSTFEIHTKVEGNEQRTTVKSPPKLSGVVIQILLLDVVFSLDSVITAVGMVDRLPIMVAAVILAVGVMLLSSEPLSRFIERHPTVKMLALSFLLLIGVSLIAEGLDHHIPKGYLYFAMAFSILVEGLNLRAKRGSPPSESR
jgi:predicted tellurium resistance membrane protein TerC